MHMLMMYTAFFCFMPTFSKQDTLTITPNQSIQCHDTLVSTEGTFEAGFFNFKSGNYFGIWYKKILPRTIVWVANRNAPAHNSTAVLKLTDQGNLVIGDDSRGAVWSSNTSTIAVKPVLQLLDSGNLVVKDSSTIIWQSFDFPGDTLLAGMKLKSNLDSGPYKYLTSWSDSDDPTEGEFSYQIHTPGFPQLVITKGSTISFSAGPWNGHLFSGVSWEKLEKIMNFSLSFTEKDVSYQYETLNSSVPTITRLRLNPNGSSERLLWSDQTRSWDVFFTHPADPCEHYAHCGVNSNCNNNSSPICECLQGFTPKFQAKWDSKDWSGGCVRKTKSSCHDDDKFLKYTGIKLPDTSSSWFDNSLSLECETYCLKNCSCAAFANLDIRGGGSGCLLWYNDIVDMRNRTGQGQTIYIRVFSEKVIGWNHVMEMEHGNLPTMFDFSTISVATNHFSNRNKLGEGGFGPVYKGILVDGQEIAVKRLSKTSRQGTEEFKNEVKLMASVQHRNLVKLFGCSIQQDEKLLIYEFMPNRSLDYFIFDTVQAKSLDWTKRLKIIEEIARGLLYLHRDSRLRIIHRDLKTSNILLDNNMIPKISDFGLARTFGGDQAEANTNRVMGTYGYMPPEYAVHGSFSTKSDVFSYGVIVLEIISGRKNRGFRDPHHHHHNLLGHAWRLWVEERPLLLIDDKLDDVTAISSEILRCIHVGLLCVQENPENRPNMSSVVLMLKGEKLLPKPSQPGFYAGKDITTDTGSSSNKNERCSVNEISISSLAAR